MTTKLSKLDLHLRSRRHSLYFCVFGKEKPQCPSTLHGHYTEVTQRVLYFSRFSIFSHRCLLQERKQRSQERMKKKKKKKRQCLSIYCTGGVRRCIVLGFCQFQGRKRDVRRIVGDATSNTFAIARDGRYLFTRHLYFASEQHYVLQSIVDDVLNVSNRPIPLAIHLFRSDSHGSRADSHRIPSVFHVWPWVSKRSETELPHKNQSFGLAGVRAQHRE